MSATPLAWQTRTVSAFDDYVASFDGDPGYLDWAAFGPISPTVRAEAFADADLLGSARPSSRALVAERLDEGRDLAAELLDVDPDTVTLQPSSSHGLMHAIFGLSGTVIASSAEFPSITMTLERAVQMSGGALDSRWITPENTFVTPDAVAEAIDDVVSALVVSHVDFRTGYRTDLAALRDVLGPDRLLIVDAVQSVGVVEDDFTAADVVVGHGYKWLRAARGTGFASFSANARERIVPVLSGLAGAEGGLPIDERPEPAESARAFSVTGPDQLAVARLAIGLRDVRDAGVAAIADTISGRVDEIFEIADRHSIPVLTPRERERRAGIVALAPEAPAMLSAALTNAGVVATTRGATVRVAAHAGTSDETLRMLDDALGTVVAPGV